MQIISLGPKGTYSDIVANQLKGKTTISYVEDIEDICLGVLKNPENRGVIPVENSTTGLIFIGVDSINRYPQVTISAEVEIPIYFDLISRQKKEKIRTFFVQREAYQQCSKFINKNLRQAEPIFNRSNIETIKNFKKHSESCAAIIPSYLSETKELQKYEQYHHIENYKNNTTRFFVIKKNSNTLDNLQPNVKVSLYFEFKRDEPSLLYKILKIFHYNKINLTMLSSRSLPHKKWTYGFFIDFQVLDKKEVKKVPKILKKIITCGTNLRILGIYKNINTMSEQEILKI